MLQPLWHTGNQCRGGNRVNYPSRHPMDKEREREREREKEREREAEKEREREGERERERLTCV